MPTVEKHSGGRVYIRPLDRRFEIGDRVDVDRELAAYLCDERGDFTRIVEKAGEAEAAAEESSAEKDDDPAEEADSDGDDTSDEVPTGESGTLPFNPESLTVNEVEEEVDDVDDVEAVRALRNLEQQQKDRTTAVEVLEARLDELED